MDPARKAAQTGAHDSAISAKSSRVRSSPSRSRTGCREITRATAGGPVPLGIGRYARALWALGSRTESAGARERARARRPRSPGAAARSRLASLLTTMAPSVVATATRSSGVDRDRAAVSQRARSGDRSSSRASPSASSPARAARSRWAVQTWDMYACTPIQEVGAVMSESDSTTSRARTERRRPGIGRPRSRKESEIRPAIGPRSQLSMA